ncbi:MAG TPA: deoxyribose-phosphate aldolase [Clostridium sp.]|jgi:deoxyribose-phosphate aldolase|nr:deoxyribose-phosphate aldolase [Clostridia bacterium]HCW04483.1 deoxyribose-phosphate aldolase [Clostridium sp.]
MTLAKYIDHTILKAEASEEDIKKLCKEAKEHGFASVCVNPYYVSLAAKELMDSDVKVCTVVGFPLGATTREVKAFETNQAIERGAQEIDMVINIGALKSKKYDEVKADIEAIVNAANRRALVKVIIESCLLTEEEKIQICTIAKNAGADFVKTSTGFSTAGATVSDVSLMRETVGKEMGVKASGGIRDYKSAKAMIEAGANRLGMSAGIAVVKAEKEEG